MRKNFDIENQGIHQQTTKVLVSCCKENTMVAFSSKHTKHALADTETTSKYVKKF
jgi:hypothetical protein